MPDKKLTLNQFLAAKADSTRNAAYEKSMNRNTGIQIVYPLDEQRRQRNNKIIEDYNSNVVQPKSVKRRIDADYQQAVKENQNNCEYGLNCIGSATDNYPMDSRSNVNDDFYTNYAQYGFKGIMLSEVIPGDIVQADSGKGPFHGMIFSRWDENGKPRFNYSSGGIEEGHYVKDGQFNVPGYYAYRYVGTPELIEQWTKEYNSKYKQGGTLPLILKFNNYGKSN